MLIRFNQCLIINNSEKQFRLEMEKEILKLLDWTLDLVMAVSIAFTGQNPF